MSIFDGQPFRAVRDTWFDDGAERRESDVMERLLGLRTSIVANVSDVSGDADDADGLLEQVDNAIAALSLAEIDAEEADDIADILTALESGADAEALDTDGRPRDELDDGNWDDSDEYAVH